MYQGCFLTHFSLMPASVLIFIEAASAAVTVCFTDCIKFCALPTNISVASRSSSVPAKSIFLSTDYIYKFNKFLDHIYR